MVVLAHLVSGRIFSKDSEAFSLFERERFGEKVEDSIIYLPVESFYLVEGKKIEIVGSKGKKLCKEELMKLFEKGDKKFLVKYLVYKNLRKKGNIVKSALKFGADYRVYEKGSRIGKEHAKWILFCLSEGEKLSMQDFSAKNRVAHSTGKKLLVAIVDDEGDVSYYESGWLKL